MKIITILAQLSALIQAGATKWRPSQGLPLSRPDLHTLYEQRDALPAQVRDCPVAMRYLDLLGPLAWDQFPERDLERNYGQAATPYAPFAAACMVQIDLNIRYMSGLRQYLVDHPALTWVLGFPLVASHNAWGFDVAASLPTQRHMTRMLCHLPNAGLQVILDSSVTTIQAALPPSITDFGECISLDTKHILAWAKENNPKAYLSADQRLDKTNQPASDPDCKLGCKRRHNQRASSQTPPDTPAENPVPADSISVGEYYWGYASGVVATKVPDWAEVVLAELTQPFNCSDVSYFFPLMADTTRRLGRRPKYGALDPAFDAFYVYDFFDAAHGFAAVPFVNRGGKGKRTFDERGLPLCDAGLAMPLKSTFISKTGLIEHECGRYACPLLVPEPTGEVCPIAHPRWPKGGCLTTLPTSQGARIRHQLDREGDAYKRIYKLRTATERINSQAVEFGIERPYLRNQAAIANRNTLIYILINARALRRVRHKRTTLEHLN